MKKTCFLIMLLSLTYCSAFAINTPDKVAEKIKLTREGIIQKDEERRAKILKKFTDFQQKVKNFAPDMKLNIPVNPDRAEDINKLDNSAEIKDKNRYYAFAADSYRLRALPYDSVKEYTAEVKRGDRILVLMKPEVKKDKAHPSLTKEWLLIKTGDGSEGYIPLNMVLNKKPDGRKRKALIMDYDVEYAYGAGFNDTIPDTGDGNFILTQYSADEAKSMKVNTPVLKVRSEPSLNGDVIYSLSKNQVVEVLEYSSHEDYYDGKTSKWAKIKIDNITGWVFGYYLVEVQGGTAGSAEADLVSYLEKGASLYVKSDILRVRDAPDDFSTVLFSLENKDRVEVTDMEPDEVTLGGKKSKWVKIKFSEYEGWVFGAFLSKDRNAFEQGDDINNIFQVPVSDGYFVSSKFGKRMLKGKASNHTGIDLAAPCGTDVVASADGTVILVNIDPRNCSSCSYGSYVIIEHKNGYRTVYGHLSAVSVKNGQKVNSGEKVGAVGNTGHSYGCHLHFEIRAYEEFVDPLNYIHP